MQEELKIIDGTYKKDDPHMDIGKQKFKVKRFHTVEVEYSVVANSKDEAESAVLEHGGIEKISFTDGYHGDEPVEMLYYDTIMTAKQSQIMQNTEDQQRQRLKSVCHMRNTTMTQSKTILTMKVQSGLRMR